MIALKKQSGTKEDLVGLVSRIFTKEDDNFFTALVRLSYEIEAQDSAPYATVPYDLPFNAK